MPRARPYRFDPKVARYRAPNGRLVARAEVRRAIDAEIRSLDQDARTLADQYRNGEISLGKWEREMRSLVKDTHILNAAAAKGGWDQLTQADYGRVGQIVRDEYNHLSGFAGELSAGFQRTDGTMLTRAQLYTRGGRRTYESVTGSVAEDAGNVEERSILHPADHCQGCIDEAAKGWQPIGTLTPIGQRTCLGNDRCTMEYR
jgi:hypothetical protein